MKDKKIIFLLCGLAATALFWFFRVELYDAFELENGFTNRAYQHYGTIALVTIAMAWGGAAVYYYVINSVKFDRWWHWLATCGVVTVLTPAVCYFVLSRLLAGSDFGSQTLAFALHNTLYTALTFVVASFSIRWWSSNCRHTPLPQ